MIKTLKHYIGLSGVDKAENAKAVRFGKLFSYLILIVLIVVIVEIVVNIVDGKPLDHISIYIGVWLVFTIEFIVSLYLVDNKKRYIRYNWMNLLIIILTIPWIPWGGNWAAIFRALRLLLFVRIFVSILKDVFSILKRNGLGVILIGALFFIVISGAVFSAFEDIPFASGLWYSLITITTVGYGDIVPVTPEGRIFGAFLIVFGVILFSLIVANVSAFLVESEQKKMECHFLDMEKTIEDRIEKVAQQNATKLEEFMHEMDKRLTNIEKNTNALESYLNPASKHVLQDVDL